MGWKIFFWIYFVLTIVSLLDVPTSPRLIDLLGYPMAVAEIVGLYAFAFKKKILTPKHWRTIFWTYTGFFGLFILSAFNLYTNAFPLLQSSRLESLTEDVRFPALTITFALFIPFIYLLHRLAYPKTSKKSK